MKINLQDIQTIITLVLLLVNVVLLVYSVIKTFIKKRKASVEGEEILAKSENVENFIEVIRHIIPQAVEQAESSGILGADNKKLLALSKILLKCNETGFDYKEHAQLINEVLEELIAFSKKVNAKKGA